MKGLTFLLVVSLFVGCLFAQQATVDLSALPEGLRNQVVEAQRAQDIEKKIERYGRWVGMGTEVGNAVDGALSAISKHANEFANTKVGMFTMAIIAFKVIGYPIIQLIVGIPLLLMGTIFFIWILKSQCLPSKIKIITGVGKDRVIEEQILKPQEDWYTVVAALCYVIYIVICMAVIFTH